MERDGLNLILRAPLYARTRILQRFIIMAANQSLFQEKWNTEMDFRIFFSPPQQIDLRDYSARRGWRLMMMIARASRRRCLPIGEAARCFFFGLMPAFMQFLRVALCKCSRYTGGNQVFLHCFIDWRYYLALMMREQLIYTRFNAPRWYFISALHKCEMVYFL